MSNAVAATLDGYLHIHPEDRDKLSLLFSQLAKGEDVTIRKNFTGHITGSGLVLSPDRKKILLVYHKFFQRWMQPGGHIDPGDAGPFEAATRELKEETGIDGLISLSAEDPPIPIDIDSHHILANPDKDEPEHWHYDFRYAFIASSEKLSNNDDGIAEVEWVPIDDPRVQNETWMQTRLTG